MKIMVGIDLHSNNTFCGLMDESGRRLVHQKLPCDLFTTPTLNFSLQSNLTLTAAVVLLTLDAALNRTSNASNLTWTATVVLLSSLGVWCPWCRRTPVLATPNRQRVFGCW